MRALTSLREIVDENVCPSQKKISYKRPQTCEYLNINNSNWEI
jgi:hypothetical protein